MTDNIGGAQYTLDLETGQFSSKLKRAESDFKAAQGRMGAAAQTQAEKLAAFEKQLDAGKFNLTGFGGAAAKTEASVAKAAASTSKLTDAQRILNGALRTSSSQLAQQIPFANGLSSAFGAASVAAGPAAAAVLGTAVAYNVLDTAVRHFSHGGIIDYLTGETHAHDLATTAIKAQGNALQDLQRLGNLGLSSLTAGSLELEVIFQRLKKAEQDAEPDTSTWGRIWGFLKDPTASPSTSDRRNAALDPNIDQAAENIRDLFQKGAISVEQFREAASDPIFGDRFRDDLAKTDKDLQLVQSSVAATADVIRNSRDQFENGLKLALGEFDRPNPVTEGLKLQLLLLEEEKRRLQDIGDDDGVKKVSAQIDAMNNAIAESDAPLKIAQQAVQAWGASALEAAGSNQGAINAVFDEVTRLGNTLTTLPTDMQIKLTLLDPQGIRNLIAALAAGLSFDVAVRLVSGTPAQVEQNLASTWAGSTPGSIQSNAVQGIVAQSNAAFDEFMKKINAASDAAGDAAPNFEKLERATKGAADYLTQVLEAAADGVISLAEAEKLHLTDAQVIILENEIARQKEADAAFRQRIELEKTAQAFGDLTPAEVEARLGLKAIADNLIATKRTAEQFKLDEWLRPAFDNVRSMIDEIFSKPTKESLQMRLQRDKLERQKLLIERRGGDTKQIDAQIAALDREIRLREVSADILKTETELKDKSLQTDADVVNAAQFLGTALGSLSQDILNNEGMYGALFDAGLKAASALNAVGAAGGSGFTAAEKHWINGVAISKGEPEPFPGFDRGALSIQQTRLAVVHKDEAILPPDVGQMFRQIYATWRRPQLMAAPQPLQLNAGTPATTISINVSGAQDDREILRKVERGLSDALRMRRYGGSTPSSAGVR